MSTTRTLDVGDLDVRGTLKGLALYGYDPTYKWTQNSFVKAVLTPDGAGSMRLTWHNDGQAHAEAHGPGAEWLLNQMPDWLGAGDDPAVGEPGGFDPTPDPRINDLWRRNNNVRMASLGVIWQELITVIIGQRVSSDQAMRSWSQLCRRWGHPAPGPDELHLPPTPAELGQIKYYELHGIGIERGRAETMITAAKRANRLEEAAAMSATDAVTRLSALPGFGAWTATATVTITHGDPDIVILRDYGIPTFVNYFFTGDAKRLPPEPDGDRIMLEHLAPWIGHRQRVMRLLMASGTKVPRRAPRANNPDFRRM